MIRLANGEEIPDTPLARAYVQSMTLLTENGGMSLSAFSAAPGNPHEASAGLEAALERLYHVPREDMQGFISGMAGTVVHAMLADGPIEVTLGALQGSLVTALAAGMQFERNRRIEQRRQREADGDICKCEYCGDVHKA